MNYLVNSNILNVALFLIIGATLVLLFYFYDKWKRSGDLIKTKRTIRHTKDSNRFKDLREQLEVVLVSNGKEKYFQPIYSTILLSFFLVFLYFLSIKHLFLAIVLPVIMYLFSVAIIKEFVVTFDEVVESNFSTLVNHMVKMLSNTNDLSIVLYESSKEISEPLRSLILTLSRELMVDNNEKVLIDFLEKTDNMWLHSFIFILINYKETSSKEDIIENLLLLAELIEDRRDISEKMAEDRKPVVIINYMLLVVGTVIAIGNMILNPIFKPFIFTFLGTFSMVVGISAMFLTVIINLKFTKIN